MFIYFNARFPNLKSDRFGDHNSPDCALRAWSKALECPYSHLMLYFDICDVEIKGVGIDPYWRYTNTNVYNKHLVYCNHTRKTGMFPNQFNWNFTFGRYIECASRIEWDEKFSQSREWKKFHKRDVLWEFDTKTTVQEFINKHPVGRYVLSLMPENGDGHAVCVIDGNIYDTWDCSKSKMYLTSWFKINEYKIDQDMKRRDVKSKKHHSKNIFDGLVA